MSDQTTATQHFNESLAALAAAGGVVLAKAMPQKPGGAPQLFHTPSDSRPKEFAGTREEAIDEDDDGMSPDGTHYLGKSLAAVQADIGEKIQKGADVRGTEVDILRGVDPAPRIKARMAKAVDAGNMPRITKAERWALEWSKAGKPFEPVEDDKEEKKEKVEKGALREFVAQQPSAATRGAIDVSPLFADLVKSQHLGFQALIEENALLKAKVDAFERAFVEERDASKAFRKALAQSVVEVGHQQAATAELLAGLAGAPAGGPRSYSREHSGAGIPVGSPHGPAVLAKGGSNGEPDSLEFCKSRRGAAIAEMLDMVKAQQIAPDVVSKFENAGELDPRIAAAVHQKLVSRGTR